MIQYFFELSGEHRTMPSAEALACVESECDRFADVSSGPGYFIASFDDSYIGAIADRIAMSQKIGRYLGRFDVSNISGFDDIEIPEGSFAVRARRFEGMMNSIDTQDLTKKLGTILSKKNEVKLKDPDTEVRIFISDAIHVFIAEKEIDRGAFEDRKVGERPFFSPISLHPKFARASVNLTRVKRGGVVLDPFCGTGGIILEAASMGMKVIASDFDEEMVIGCQENMEHFGFKLHDSAVIDVGDISEHFDDVDAVVTDPPYGRSTHTGGEDISEIYRRGISAIDSVLPDGGRATVVLPYEIADPTLIRENVFMQRVHRSLSRYYHVFRK